MATVQNIVIDQGTTFSLDINLTNDDGSAKDLTNYTVASQMRKSYEASTATDFTTVKVDASGKVTISLTATQTSAVKAPKHKNTCISTSTSISTNTNEMTENFNSRSTKDKKQLSSSSSLLSSLTTHSNSRTKMKMSKKSLIEYFFFK